MSLSPSVPRRCASGPSLGPQPQPPVSATSLARAAVVASTFLGKASLAAPASTRITRLSFAWPPLPLSSVVMAASSIVTAAPIASQVASQAASLAKEHTSQSASPAPSSGGNRQRPREHQESTGVLLPGPLRPRELGPYFLHLQRTPSGPMPRTAGCALQHLDRKRRLCLSPPHII
ncbi:uncharacterized protein BJ171DRAFT_490727 [Polychytrium aggregatum]|uniref:uncharacterized protein n=1 Tax=Polychytrium aggregatum TaxID=110093 RepID=UPI0022FEAFC4|nr:uncharacterized protein BJ171DRAFT_490727 [Polychytrium aggregatum]KAI9208238.1 hypothetical protein BJ171DRAFT_490727 [Polychytrium aggregatum]